MNDNPDMIADNSDIRPDLRPVDPRASASPTNDFTIAGSIDNENVFDVSTGKSIPSRF